MGPSFCGPGGILILSTPNREGCSPARNRATMPVHHEHVREMSLRRAAEEVRTERRLQACSEGHRHLPRVPDQLVAAAGARG